MRSLLQLRHSAAAVATHHAPVSPHGRAPTGPGSAQYSGRMPRSPLVIGADTERERAARIGIGRLAVGSTLMASGFARRLFGVPREHDNGALRLVARLAGIRSIALGAWALQVRDHSVAERRLCYQINAAVDA